MMLIQFIILISILWFVYNRVCNKKIMDLSSKLKSDIYTLPVIGQAYLFMGNNEHLMNALKRFGKEAIKYDGFTKIWHANHLFIVIAEPETIDILSKSCLCKPDLLKITRYLIGNGSIFAPVPIWRPRRKVLASIFSIKTLNGFVPIFARQSIDLKNTISRLAGKEPFSVWEYFTTYTMNSVCETTLGIKIDRNDIKNENFLKAFDELAKLGGKLLLQPWKNNALFQLYPEYYVAMKNIDTIVNFVKDVIRNKQKELKNENNMREDLTLLEHLLSSDKGLSDTEVLEEVLVIIIAGTDTSAVGSSFTSVMLAMHQDVQEKLYQELKAVFGESDRPVQVSDLPKLKYTEAVIKETLRLYPPIPIIAREAEKDIDLPSGLKVPSGCGILFHIWALHRNPALWGNDAEQFRPERFLDDKSQLHPAAFMPFSYGPRGCLGNRYAMMKMKTVIATLMRQYRVLPANEEQKQQSLRVEFDIMMRHVDKYMIRLENRN